MLQQQIEGKYELLGQLEDEGGAEVYKVLHLFLDEVRLIKMVRPQGLAMTQEGSERFLREARAVIKLRHPNIAQLHDFTIDDEGNAFIVTELIEGLTLEETLGNEGPPPVALTLPIAQQALRALGYLHRAGMVHRGVSPDKLMLTRDVDGRALVKWVDLGTARVLAAGEGTQAGAGIFPARPQYASPEQFGAGGDGAVDARSDVYSFGVVLYELLTGRLPIVGHDPFSLMAGHLSSPPRSFAETDPEGRVPADLRKAVLRTLAKKPEERIASADELSSRLTLLQDPLADDRGDYLDRVLRRARQRTAVVIPPPAPRAPLPKAPPPKAPSKAPPPKAAPVPAPAPEPTRPVEAAPSLPPDPLPLDLGAGSPRAEPRTAGFDWDKVEIGHATQALRTDPTPPAEEPPQDLLDASPPPPPDAAEPGRPWPKTAVLAAGAVLAAAALVGGGWWLGRPGKPVESSSPAIPQGTSAPTPTPIQTIEVKAESPKPEPPKRPKHQAAPEGSPAPKPPAPEPKATPVATPPKETVPKPPAPPPEQPGRGSLITGGPGVEAAEVTSLAQVIYPERARGTGRKAAIKVAVLVDENGNVAQVRIKEGDPSGLGFNEAALEAAQKTRFLPATKDGVPGKSWTEVMFEFNDPGARPN
ncbi:MAG TPA: TonB family protein [Thermoanaerobaculia bacterium]|nr:TonB family protein [Thermoanaerobaculia bacterium]